MPSRIEDYAIIGDCQSVALVGKDGSIDWLCLPRFDSDACFAALLGTPEHGRWLLAPVADPDRVRVRRRYREGTLTLETDFETPDGTVTVVDFMPIRGEAPDVVRIAVGKSGAVKMRMQLVLRPGYGATVPWVRSVEGDLRAVAGPDMFRLQSPVPTRGEELTTVADFTVRAGEKVPFVLTWSPSHLPPPDHVEPHKALEENDAFWLEWSAKCQGGGAYEAVVKRSLITLKALTYAPTGGIVAAATTSLPEQLGGVRNWDYRFCWVRDATFTLYALMNAGYSEEARAWREWLLRAVAGTPAQIQTLYGIAGERRLPELELPWLPGYEGAKPVRIGNAASGQLQLDVFGELMDTLHASREVGVPFEDSAWRVQVALIGHLEKIWKEPDEGIWEVRGPRRHFTHSKIMAWVAMDRAVKMAEASKVDAPLDRWRQVRDEIHAMVCREGFDRELGSFVQYFGSKDPDASLLLAPLVGFLPPTDPRVAGTVRAVERLLLHDGLVRRYPTRPEVDGLPDGEGVFLACSFWLADNYVLLGRKREATELFERLVALANDVGLLAEEYDPVARRQCGNFPQAFSHVSLVNTARNLSNGHGPARHRGRSHQ